MFFLSFIFLQASNLDSPSVFVQSSFFLSCHLHLSFFSLFFPIAFTYFLKMSDLLARLYNNLLPPFYFLPFIHFNIFISYVASLSLFYHICIFFFLLIYCNILYLPIHSIFISFNFFVSLSYVFLFFLSLSFWLLLSFFLSV